jgi:membrane protein insertase Oxa1/YidC/SpoIIIJ
MIFVGILFFKVASGLCVYFIASSLWGLAERQFLPKAATASAAGKPQSRAEAKAQQAKSPPKPAPQRSAPGRDGSPARKKRKKNRGSR